MTYKVGTFYVMPMVTFLIFLLGWHVYDSFIYCFLYNYTFYKGI
ncbi:hypothetical protein [Bacillus cereus]